MKKLIGFSTLCVLMTLGACTGSGNKKTADDAAVLPVVEFEGYRYDVIASVPDSDALDTEGGKFWRFSGTGMLPVKVGNKDVSVLRDSLERLGGVMVIDKTHSAPILDSPLLKDMGLTATDFDPKSTKACSSYYNQLSVALCTPAVVVWKDYSYSYLCMAAHGMYNTSFVNYSIEDGKILSVADLMKPGYEKELTVLIRQKLKEMNVPLLVDINEVGIPKDFEITSQGLRFMYGLYEIAAYVEGEVTVEFDSYELEDLFAPGVFARYFSLTPDAQ